MRVNAIFLATLCIPLIGSSQTAPQGMRPRVLMGDSSHCGAIVIRNGHLVSEEVCTRVRKAEVTWDGLAAVISETDEKASREWMRKHSLLPRLSIKHHDLYWEDRKVDLGKVNVYHLYEAIPWEGGVIIYGRTVPRRGFWGSWPFKGHFIEVRDIDPFCAIYFDPNTMKGEDLWLNGKAYLGLFVFPVPD